MAAAPSNEPENDNVFLDVGAGLLDPADSSSSSTSRKPSYDSRESKSISECSYVSGSPCGSPVRPLELATPYSSTCTMESDPPGDQTCLDPFQSEKEFIDYLMSLPTSKPDSLVEHGLATKREVQPPPQEASSATNRLQSPGSQSPKIGLDHLENLCKLMEQLGELREHNFKLQKRVQYLEEVRCLNEMRKDLKEALEGAMEPHRGALLQSQDDRGSWDLLPDSSGSSGRRATPRGTLTRRKETPEVPFEPEVPLVPEAPLEPEVPKRAKSHSKLRKATLQQQRLRSQSMGDDDMFRKCNPASRKSKVSKWTKVKEALKWERVQVEPRGGAADARSSFFVDIDDETQQLPLMVSKATLTLIPVPKPQPGQSTASVSYDEQKAKTTGRSITKPEMTEEGAAALSVPYLMTDPYPESTSEEEEDTVMKEADPREKRRSTGATLEFDVLDGDPCRKVKCSGKYQLPHGTMADDEQAALKERKGRSLERTDPDHRANLIRYSHSEKECKKFSKGAWGKVKNIIQTRKDSLKRKHRKSGGVEVVEQDFSSSEGFVFGDEAWAERYDLASYGRAIVEDDRHPALAAADSVAQVKSKHSSSSSNYGGEDLSLDPFLEKPKGKRGKAQQLTIQVPTAEDPEARLKYRSTTPPTLSVPATGYSPNSQRKSKWNKVKNVFLERRKTEMGQPQRPQSVPASPTNLTSFTYEDLGILEEYLLDAKNWAERSDNHDVECGPYDSSVAALQSLLSDAESTLVPMAAETKRNLEELQRNISQDFSKKMQEWEKLKTGCPKQQLQQGPPSPKLDRKGSTQKSRKGKGEKGKEKVVKQREKELQWLEKQLQKIEREKQRLAKERQKYLKREARLEKMKETMLHPPDKNEVLVRTAAGEFRFEGISQTFTRKLYEWEEMKGIGPEVSTIALLDAQHPEQPLQESMADRTPHTLSPPIPRYGRLDRNRSRSEGSIVDIVNVQTSTTSLAPDDLVDDVFTEALPTSRAASEPDIVGYDETEDPPCALEVEEMHFEEAVPCLEIPAVRVEEPVYSYAPSEVTRLIDSSGSSDAEKEAGCDRKTSVCRVQEAKIPEVEEGGGGGGGNIQEEDLRLLQKLTAKEEICRQLENDLEDLDGRMKMMFQQHSEEIQKLKSHEADSSEDKQEMWTSTPGSPVGTSKQKQLILELRARIVELEKAGDSLKKEREDLEKTFKLNSEQQTQLTQHLAARITELQQKNARIRQIAGDQKLTEKLSGQTKKKQGVVKVQEISAELLHQAKTLEQALLDRNATIRQLQWELLQRDMSAMQLQTELQNVKDKTVDALGGIKDSKRKDKHERSWSSVDATCMASKKQEDENNLSENQKPLTFQRFADNADLAIRPLELTRKVRELKTELMRLWSSTESATSGSSEHGTEDADSLKEKDNSGNGVDITATSALLDIKESLSSQSVETHSKSIMTSPSVPQTKTIKISMEELKMHPPTEAKIIPRANSSEDTVTARRMSDTSIPQEMQLPLHLTMSPKQLHEKRLKSLEKQTRNADKMEDSGKAKEGLIISKIPSRVCPTSPPLASRSTARETNETKLDEQTSNTTALSITLSLKSKQSKTSSGQGLRPERTSKLKKMAAVSRPSPSSEEKESENKLVKSDSVVLPPSPAKSSSSSSCASTKLKLEEPSTTAVVVLPQKALPKSECMPYSKKNPTPKDHRNVLLQRQNAEDIGSSSDTDTEGSGITFTINLGKKDASKLKDTIATTRTENVTGRIPLQRSEKVKEGGAAPAGHASPNTSRLLLDSRRGSGVLSPPQTPSPQPWRKLLREDTVIQRPGYIGAKGSTGPSQIPAAAPPRPPVEAVRSPPSTPKEYKAPDPEEIPTAPETPVVKSRSTRKLKLPTTGKIDPGVVQGKTPPGSGLEPSPLRTRRSHPAKETAPNVKSMIEKYNQKLAEQPPVSLLKSPQLGIQRCRANGVQKSTSFTDPSATSTQQAPAAGECVLKSASASTIEGSTRCPGSPSIVPNPPGSPFIGPIPPMSPESLKRSGQPIGIASRIPRCLKPISEQDSIEATKEEAARKHQESERGAPPSPATEGPSRPRFQSADPAFQSPKAGMRLVQLRRAREEFLAKNSSTTAAAAAERHQHSSTESDCTASPASASALRPCGWSPFVTQAQATPPESPMKRSATDSSSEELNRPRGILKASRRDRETPWTTREQDPAEPKADASGRITKSASAGAMDEATLRSTSSEDGSKSSETLPQNQKCGLFHFKFRRAKMKQKKEPLNAVKALCRQSLLVNIEPGSMPDSPCSPGVGSRSCPSSPELQPRPAGKTGWLSKPRILFKSK